MLLNKHCQRVLSLLDKKNYPFIKNKLNIDLFLMMSPGKKGPFKVLKKRFFSLLLTIPFYFTTSPQGKKKGAFNAPLAFFQTLLLLLREGKTGKFLLMFYYYHSYISWLFWYYLMPLVICSADMLCLSSESVSYTLFTLRLVWNVKRLLVRNKTKGEWDESCLLMKFPSYNLAIVPSFLTNEHLDLNPNRNEIKRGNNDSLFQRRWSVSFLLQQPFLIGVFPCVESSPLERGKNVVRPIWARSRELAKGEKRRIIRHEMTTSGYSLLPSFFHMTSSKAKFDSSGGRSP